MRVLRAIKSFFDGIEKRQVLVSIFTTLVGTAAVLASANKWPFEHSPSRGERFVLAANHACAPLVRSFPYEDAGTSATVRAAQRMVARLGPPDPVRGNPPFRIPDELDGRLAVGYGPWSDPGVEDTLTYRLSSYRDAIPAEDQIAAYNVNKSALEHISTRFARLSAMLSRLSRHALRVLPRIFDRIASDAALAQRASVRLGTDDCIRAARRIEASARYFETRARRAGLPGYRPSA